MSIQSPSGVAPPRPVAGAAAGPLSVLGEDDLGRHSGASDHEGGWSGAGDGAYVRLDERAALPAGAGDGHGVVAGRHREVVGGVAEADAR